MVNSPDTDQAITRPASRVAVPLIELAFWDLKSWPCGQPSLHSVDAK
jgi:hypothetical protein